VVVVVVVVVVVMVVVVVIVVVYDDDCYDLPQIATIKLLRFHANWLEGGPITLDKATWLYALLARYHLLPLLLPLPPPPPLLLLYLLLLL